MLSEFPRQSNSRRQLYATPFSSRLRYVLHADFASHKGDRAVFVFPLQSLITQSRAFCTTRRRAQAAVAQATGEPQHNRYKLDHAPNETIRQHICYVARIRHVSGFRANYCEEYLTSSSEQNSWSLLAYYTGPAYIYIYIYIQSIHKRMVRFQW